MTEMYKRYACGDHSLSDLRDFLNENGYLKSRYAVPYILKNLVYLGIVGMVSILGLSSTPKEKLPRSRGSISRWSIGRLTRRFSRGWPTMPAANVAV